MGGLENFPQKWWKYPKIAWKWKNFGEFVKKDSVKIFLTYKIIKKGGGGWLLMATGGEIFEKMQSSPSLQYTTSEMRRPF